MLCSSRARLTVLALPLAVLAAGAQSVSPSVDWPMEDLTKNATIVASFVYHAAMADTKVPRKPLRPQGGAR